MEPVEIKGVLLFVIIPAIFLIVAVVANYYEEIKKFFGWKLTAKRARKLADKKTDKREDEAFDFYLTSIEMAAERGEREAVFREMREEIANKLEDLGYEVIYEVKIYDKAVRKHIVKW